MVIVPLAGMTGTSVPAGPSGAERRVGPKSDECRMSQPEQKEDM